MEPVDYVRACRQTPPTDSIPALATLGDPAFRRSLYGCLHADLQLSDARLLRQLLAIEVACWTSEDPNMDPDHLALCALLLSGLGLVDDVLPLWRAKNVDFDSACGFDIQFVVGPGVEQTVSYLSSLADPEAADALEYISECRENGDFDDLASWRKRRTDYFRPSLERTAP